MPRIKHYRLSTTSQSRLYTCCDEIIEIIEEAIRYSPIDFGIPQDGGRRSACRQNELFLAGASKKDGFHKHSKHQSGDAVDVIAYVPSVGGYTYDYRYYHLLAGHIMATAKRLGYKLRWGGDWDSDKDLDDQTFKDIGHFELMR